MVNKRIIECIASTVIVCAASGDDLSIAGSLVPAHRDVTVVRSDGSTFVATIYYPGTSASTGAPLDPSAGPYPIVAFGHGFLSATSLYASTGTHLASWGIVTILPQSQGGFLPNHAAFAADLVASLNWLAAQNTVTGSPWLGSMDGARRGVMGHSMGGGAAVLAAKSDPRIRALVGLAAADTNPSSITAALNVRCAARLIVGSQDTIVPPASTAAMFPNLAGSSQSISITGGFHCGFVDAAIIACDSGSITRAQQLAITRREVTEFLLLYLRGDLSRCEEVWGLPSAGAGIVQQNARTADINGDGRVDGSDLAALLSSFGHSGCADLNDSGIVDGSDLSSLLAGWTG